MHPNLKQHLKTMVSLIDRAGYHGRRMVFADFVEMAAIAYSNRVDLIRAEKREAHYLKLIAKYQKKDQHIFGELLKELVEAHSLGADDVLGRLFHELDAASTERGQFFTPYHLCQLMARLLVGDGSDLKRQIEERGFIRLNEPACGAGAMVMAFAQAMLEAGINYQQHLHVTLQDIDARAVHMAYMQMAMLHIPAVIIHGNTLTVEEFDHWYTPAHVMGAFGPKLRRGYALDSVMGRNEEQRVHMEDGDTPVPVEVILASKAPAFCLTEQVSLF